MPLMNLSIRHSLHVHSHLVCALATNYGVGGAHELWLLRFQKRYVKSISYNSFSWQRMVIRPRARYSRTYLSLASSWRLRAHGNYSTPRRQ